jgi:monothiol glutaredoxin
MSDTNSRIKSEIESSDVVLFMKGTPQAPQCGFSMQVVQILNHLSVPYKAINVLADGEIREGIKSFSNWPTIPQLYVKNEFIGGCDITREMFQSGELTALFDKEGVPHAQAGKA